MFEKTEYKENGDSLRFLAKLFEYRLAHHEDQAAAARFTKGKAMGNLLQRDQELDVWATVAHHERITNPEPVICEIGFAWGFSAVAILSEHPSAKYVGFDIGAQFTKDAFVILKASFPDRLEVIWGDSSTSIRKLAEDPEKDIRCDIWIIDGDHGYEGAKKDLDAIVDTADQLTRDYPNNLVLWDDTPLDQESLSQTPAAIVLDRQPHGCCDGSGTVLVEAVQSGKIEFLDFGTDKDELGRAVTWSLTSLEK